MVEYGLYKLFSFLFGWLTLMSRSSRLYFFGTSTSILLRALCGFAGVND